MFRSLRSSKLPEGDVFAVTIGAASKQTLASYHVLEPADVISAIEALNKSGSANAKSSGGAPAVAASAGVAVGGKGSSVAGA